MQTSFAERAYHAACAAEANRAYRSALACNDLLTLDEARFLKACIGQEDWTRLVEDRFDEVGWPEDDLDTAWLDEAGAVTWEVFKSWRAA